MLLVGVDVAAVIAPAAVILQVKFTHSVNHGPVFPGRGASWPPDASVVVVEAIPVISTEKVPITFAILLSKAILPLLPLLGEAASVTRVILLILK